MKHLNNSHGAVAVMIALLMFIFLGFAAFAVDLGMVWVANKQLQNAADAGALAGARALGYYDCKQSGGTTCQNLPGVITTGTPDQAVNPTVVRVVGENVAVGTSSLEIDDAGSDIQIGWWYQNDWHNIPPADDPGAWENAVSVAVRKEQDTANGAVNAFFGKLLNVNEYNLNKNSVAALTGIGKTESGEVIPLAVSTAKNCNAPITLNDTTTSCAGWTSFHKDFKNQNVSDFITGKESSPPLSIHDTINMKGGTVTPLLNDLRAEYDKHAPTWNVLVAVYADNCQNPTPGNSFVAEIMGFATFSITNVIPTGSDKGVYGALKCDVISEGQGGGADFGTLGTIPGLVR